MLEKLSQQIMLSQINNYTSHNFHSNSIPMKQHSQLALTRNKLYKSKASSKDNVQKIYELFDRSNFISNYQSQANAHELDKYWQKRTGMRP